MKRIFTPGILVVALWLTLVVGGFALLQNYQNTPGSETPSGPAVVTKTQVPAASQATLLLFAHPQCPCTRATIEELNRLLARTPAKVAAQVWFFQPKDATEDWVQTDLWRSAAAIPGVTVRADVEGAEAARFGAETSGCVLLYGADGRMLFKGGITGGRGHAGDNAGENAILDLLAGRSVSLEGTPVYGCSLVAR